MPHEGRGCGRHMEDSPHGGSHAAHPAASSKATQVVFAPADRCHSTAPGPEASGSMMTPVDASAGEKPDGPAKEEHEQEHEQEHEHEQDPVVLVLVLILLLLLVLVLLLCRSRTPQRPGGGG